MLNRQKILIKSSVFICLLFLSGCKSEIDLYANIDEQDANEIVAALVSKSIGARKVQQKKGFSVVIDESEMAWAVNLLNAQGLPRKHKISMGEIFKKEGVISTPLEERARYIYALSQELELTLSEMDGVISARVHVVLPERIAPGEPINPSSAAVFIKHESSYDPDIFTARVKQLIASSIPGLVTHDKDKIAIVYSASEKLVLNTEQTTLSTYKMKAGSTEWLQGKAMILLLGMPVLLILFILIPNEKPRRWLLSKYDTIKPAVSTQ